MKQEKMKDKKILKQQYKNESNLELRRNFHEKYSVNQKGYVNWMFEQYDFFDGCKILELGCGPGVLWKGRVEYIGKNSSLILSDLSEGMVKKVSEEYADKHYIESMQIDIEDIPFEDAQFDFVIANSMLYHVPDVSKAITEVYRVLKKGGKFYGGTFGENGMTSFLNETLNEFDSTVERKREHTTFTLQNGKTLLDSCFECVTRLDYIDRLDVTNTNDLVDYILSMSSFLSITDANRDELYHFYERRKNQDNIIDVPKEYGMFVAVK